MTDGTSPPETFEALAQRVDDLRDKVVHQGHEAQALLNETIEAITKFNRAGLAALVQLLRSDARGAELLYEAVDIPEVMALMVSHGIVRADLTLDVLRVVDQLRPHLMAASVNLEVVRVEGDTVIIRYSGSRPEAELDEGIRDALLTRVQGLSRIEEEADEPPSTFVPLSSLTVRRS